MATYGGISKLYITHIRFYLFFSFTEKYAGRKLNNLMWLRMAGEFMSICIFLGTVICLMSHLLTADIRPGFQLNVDKYGKRSHIYLFQLCIWLIYCLIGIHDGRAQSQVSSKRQFLFIYYVKINTLWTEIQGYHLTRLV